jgi:ornithine carbamoyltransferase
MKDTARVLGRMYDAIEYRGFKQEIVELAKFAGVPVFNGLTDEYHPTQMIADVLTMREHSDKPLHDISYAYLGDARNNMGNSLLLIGAKLGMDVRIAAPKALWPHDDLVAAARNRRRKRCAHHPHRRPKAAVKGVDFIHTDVWVSMGEPVEAWASASSNCCRTRSTWTDESHRQPAHQVHALPAGVPQQRYQGRQADRRTVSAPGQRHRSDR